MIRKLSPAEARSEVAAYARRRRLTFLTWLTVALGFAFVTWSVAHPGKFQRELKEWAP